MMECDFKKGDIVICINASRPDLTQDKRYIVQTTSKMTVRIINDDGILNGYFTDRFLIDVIGMRNETLNNILK